MRKLKGFSKYSEKIRKMVSKDFVVGLLLGAALLGIVENVGCYLISTFRLKSEENKYLYSLGQLYGRRIESMRFTEPEARMISRGFQDWIARKLDRVDFPSNQEKLQKFLDARIENQIQLAKQQGDEYLSKYVKAGAMHALSGLAYRIIHPGASKKPTPSDWIEVRYQGHLIDGKMIDGTDSQGSTAKFPMASVIPGWTEGLQLIGEGGEIELVVPSSLAYGDAETSSGIPPGSTLVFKIQLVRVLGAQGK